MKVRIHHYARYQYSEPVYLEPHVLKLTPRQHPWYGVMRSQISVSPEPAGRSEGIDVDGNVIHVIWFNELVNQLVVHAEMELDVVNQDPYRFMVFPASGLKLPMVYLPNVQIQLEPACRMKTDDPVIREYARSLAEEADWQTVPFLGLMVSRIQSDFAYQYRRFGDIHSSLKTMTERKGSCRDLVALAMDVCRSLGLASRFVSGYYLDQDLVEKAELHAWLEVFIPGAGWRGFDPTHGVACYGRHIALSASADPLLAASVTGSYRGGASSQLDIQMEFQDVS